MRRKAQLNESGKATLIEDTPGFSIEVDRAEKPIDFEESEKRWKELKASLVTHDVVLDNRTNKLRLKKRDK
jgi:hypothetical protein